MSVADRLNKLTTDITNAYTSIENKGGTIPANKNTNNLPTAIDSIEVIEQATAEGESLSLTNTKAMPYKDYVVKGKSEQEGEPTSSNPSEIHSVADDVNLLSGLSIYTNSHTISPKLDLDTGTYTFSYTGEPSSGLYIRKNDAISGEVLLVQYNTTRITFTVIEKGDYYIDLYLSGDWNTKTVTNAQLKKGSTLLPYSPYNQGTVTIKQRGKNLFNINDFVEKASTALDVTSIGNEIELKRSSTTTFTYSFNFKENTQYTIKLKTKNKNSDYYVFYVYSDNTTETIFQSSIYNEYIEFTKVSAQGKTLSGIRIELYGWNNDMFLKDIQIEEGTQATSYEPYQGYDKVFQTEPLRSLPNGVRDSLEDDGIHRRVGRVVLDGSETGWYKQDNTSYSQDYLRFTISITDKINAINPNSQKDNILSDKFTNKILDNNATRQSNSITGQFSTNLINIFIAQNIINGSRVDDFKTWLSTHNTELLYELEQEIIEPLTQNQATTMLDIIKTGSYEGTTNIYTDEDVKPTMKVGYYKKG